MSRGQIQPDETVLPRRIAFERRISSGGGDCPASQLDASTEESASRPFVESGISRQSSLFG
jgi:hypothetical protein